MTPNSAEHKLKEPRKRMSDDIDKIEKVLGDNAATQSNYTTWDPMMKEEGMEGETKHFRPLEDTLPPPDPKRAQKDTQEDEPTHRKEVAKQPNLWRHQLT